MREINAFFAFDILSILRWYKTQAISKLLVLLGFAFVFGVIVIGIFSYTQFFFKNLAGYQVYGFLSATYMMHAAIVVLLLLALASSIMSHITYLLTPSKKNDYFLTLPIAPSKLVWWFFIRSSFLNIILVVLLIIPICLSFGIAFFPSNLFLFFLASIALILSLVLLSNAFGGFISYFIAPYVKGRGLAAAFIGILTFIVTGLILVKLIFPPELDLLYHAEPEDFFSLYNRLPLSNPLLPTYWLIALITFKDFSFVLAILTLTFTVVLFSLRFQSKKYISLYQLLAIHKDTLRNTYKAYANRYQSFTKLPLFYKDWLSIIRSPQEAGYGIFLLSLAFFFFFILSRAGYVGDIGEKQTLDFVIFSFIWLLFFTTAYLLRLVFPLMAREGKSAWFLFTLPISIHMVVWSKIFTGLVLTTPHIILSMLMWLLLPFDTHIGMLTIISVLAVFLLSLSNGFLGTIAPNFPQGHDPEKVSTSTMGITTLIVSMIITGAVVYSIYQFLSRIWPAHVAIMIILGIGLLIILSLAFLSRLFSKRYEFG